MQPGSKSRSHEKLLVTTTQWKDNYEFVWRESYFGIRMGMGNYWYDALRVVLGTSYKDASQVTFFLSTQKEKSTYSNVAQLITTASKTSTSDVELQTWQLLKYSWGLYGCARLESRPGNSLYWRKVLRCFFQFFQSNSRLVFQTGSGRFLPKLSIIAVLFHRCRTAHNTFITPKFKHISVTFWGTR